MVRGRSLWAIPVTLALVAAACSSTSPPTTVVPPTEPGTIVTVTNEGGAAEGHTPTAFAGTGTGLFVGDNLNASFPDGVGVQTYLEFALATGTIATAATLRSDVLITSGTPFADLGDLVAEAVTYETFGPDLFDLRASGPPAPCQVNGGTAVVCDVTAAVTTAMSEGRSKVQIRLRFTGVADNDGAQDLAMFYRANSNENEPGLFTLTIEG
ncbi:MAG: hypothetical protein M3132_05290 [Actinomycetia bacterium]|nr:hypothetical protein [Actinomycetes bacterium]